MIPEELLKLSGGYWSSCALHAGVKLDLFTHLAEKPATAGELSRAIGCDRRGATMLLDALASLELLEKTGDSYGTTPFSADYLSRKSERYLGHIILHHHHLMEGWSRLDEAVRSGAPTWAGPSRSRDETVRESFLMGMFNMANQAAPRIVSAIDLSNRRRLLDLGGGPGTYAIHFCRQNPLLQAVVYDLPTTRRFAEQAVESAGLSERITFSAGDITTDPVGGGFDVLWISQLLHGEGPESAARIVKKGVQALLPGSLVLVQEFILDDSRTAPLFPALFSLNMLINTAEGQSYSQEELVGMLTQAGVTGIRRLQLDLPSGAGIMVGVVG
jgi:SAM-dependent methyltransferase